MLRQLFENNSFAFSFSITIMGKNADAISIAENSVPVKVSKKKKSVTFGGCTTKWFQPNSECSESESSTTFCNLEKEKDRAKMFAIEREKSVTRKLRHVPLSLITKSPENESLFRKLLSMEDTFQDWTFLEAFQSAPPADPHFTATFAQVRKLFENAPSLDYDTFARRLYLQLEMNLDDENLRFDLFRPLLFSFSKGQLTTTFRRRPITIWGVRSSAMAGTVGELLFGDRSSEFYEAPLSTSLMTSSSLFFCYAVKLLECLHQEIAHLRQHFRLEVQPALWFEFFLLLHSQAAEIGQLWRRSGGGGSDTTAHLRASTFGRRLEFHLRLLTNIEEVEEREKEKGKNRKKESLFLLDKLIDELLAMIGEALRLPVVSSDPPKKPRKRWSRRHIYPLEVDWANFLNNFYFTVTAVQTEIEEQSDSSKLPSSIVFSMTSKV